MFQNNFVLFWLISWDFRMTLFFGINVLFYTFSSCLVMVFSVYYMHGIFLRRNKPTKVIELVKWIIYIIRKNGCTVFCIEKITTWSQHIFCFSSSPFSDQAFYKLKKFLSPRQKSNPKVYECLTSRAKVIRQRERDFARNLRSRFPHAYRHYTIL